MFEEAPQLHHFPGWQRDATFPKRIYLYTIFLHPTHMLPVYLLQVTGVLPSSLKRSTGVW